MVDDVSRVFMHCFTETLQIQSCFASTARNGGLVYIGYILVCIGVGCVLKKAKPDFNDIKELCEETK